MVRTVRNALRGDGQRRDTEGGRRHGTTAWRERQGKPGKRIAGRQGRWREVPGMEDGPSDGGTKAAGIVGNERQVEQGVFAMTPHLCSKGAGRKQRSLFDVQGCAVLA
ncbi:hypothetical protein ERJ75_000174300 [Trypanosoma vivax]|nr:hypothetical protein ERJ75_000174300 [Trypanosoma vivax]